MAPHIDTFMPIMTMDVAKLNDGVMMMHGVSDPSKAAEFHAVCAQMSKAGEATMTMTDEQAKAELCMFCQGIRTAMKSGAKMSQGETKLGDVMVMTSADAAVQAQLFALADQCQMMSEMMSKDMAKH
jgi:Flp pilus assembly secretin CpaC